MPPNDEDQERQALREEEAATGRRAQPGAAKRRSRAARTASQDPPDEEAGTEQTPPSSRASQRQRGAYARNEVPHRAPRAARRPPAPSGMNQQQAKSAVTFFMVALGIMVMVSQNFVGKIQTYISSKSTK